MPINRIEFHRTSLDEWVTAEFRDPADEDGIRLYGAGEHPSGYMEIMYADIPGNSWNPQRLAKFQEVAQQRIDFRVARSTLPDDEPTKTVDPARPDYFWDGNDIVARSVIISDLAWSDPATGGSGLTFTLTRARQ